MQKIRNILTSVVVVWPALGQIASEVGESVANLPEDTSWVVLIVTLIAAMSRVTPVSREEWGLD